MRKMGRIPWGAWEESHGEHGCNRFITLNDVEEKGTADPINKGLPFLCGASKV